MTYRTVRELTREELEELKERMFQDALDVCPELVEYMNDSSDITDHMVYSHYEGVLFVEDDFWCNQ